MRKIFLALALVTSSAFAAVPTSDFEFLFNRLPGQPLARKYAFGTMLKEGLLTMTCVYDFAKVGGAQGDLAMYQTDGVSLCTLPAKAIVFDGLIDVITNPTSNGSATIALKLASGGDIKGATAKASFTGKLDVIPVGTAATVVKLSAAKSLVSTVATADLTAGKWRVFLKYLLSE